MTNVKDALSIDITVDLATGISHIYGTRHRDLDLLLMPNLGKTIAKPLHNVSKMSRQQSCMDSGTSTRPG